MISQKVKIINPTGLHLRPAAELCKLAMEYESNVTFRGAEGTFNAKSVLSVLGACVRRGDVIELTCEGPDEDDAIRALVESINKGLGEY
ncbi:MAG: HPr family phosphocarrier protein [Clostridiales bacterium]|nr:HPr family phosphocarrier protein [Candidatus Blautia equi]